MSLIFPNYCLGRGLMDLAYNELLNQIYILTGETMSCLKSLHLSGNTFRIYLYILQTLQLWYIIVLILISGRFDKIQSPFEWEIVLRSLVFMITEGVVFFIITLIIEYKLSIRRKWVVVFFHTSKFMVDTCPGFYFNRGKLSWKVDIWEKVLEKSLKN